MKISWWEDDNVVELYLKHDGEESSEKIIESAPIESNKKEELVKKKSNFYLKDHSYNKQETITFKKKKFKSNNRTIDKKFDSDVNKIRTKESNIGNEFDNDVVFVRDFGVIEKETNTAAAAADELTPGNQSVLRQYLLKRTYRSRRKLHLKEYSCQQCPYQTCRKPDLDRHAKTHGNLKKGHQIKHITDATRKFLYEMTFDEIRWFKFKCPRCNFKTAYKNNLNEHQLIHKKKHTKSNGPVDTRV